MMKYLLDGYYEIVDESKNDIILFADFGKAGLERAEEEIKKIKDKGNLFGYGVFGSVRGIYFLIRNVLAENITSVFLVGKEKPPFFSFTALELLKKKGIDERKKIVGFEEEIEKKHKMKPLINDVLLSKELVDEFRKHVNVIRIKDIEEYKASKTKEASDDRKQIMKRIREENKNENSSEKRNEKETLTLGDSIFGRTIEETHKLILLKILKSGHIVESQYGKTKEIINLMATVENPYDELFENEEYLKYGKDLVDPKLKSDEYTYGSLISRFKGNLNQLNLVIENLKESKESRAAVVALFIPEEHLTEKSNQPCLDIVQFLVRKDIISLTAYFRSNDMFSAWPTNIAGLAYLNDYVCKKINEKHKTIKPGQITTVSASAHIYEDNWSDAEKKSKGVTDIDFIEDKFGYFILKKEKNSYLADVYDKEGNKISSVEDVCAGALRRKIVRMFSITAEHSSYIGETLALLEKGEEGR